MPAKALHPAEAVSQGERGDEVLFLSERSRIVRRSSHAGTVICKQWLGADAVKRARHEASIIARLAPISGVSKLATAPSVDAILLQDDDGIALSAITGGKSVETGALLDIALELAKIIADVHRLGVMHRDINPSNILLAGPGRTPVLIDFDIASSSLEERPAFTAHAEIAGTLAYVAPEQTGRTGRTVDQRADLYSLGITLYELATGRLPFESGDAFTLVRDHLAREATPPALVDARVPQPLSDIIVRLMQKEPDRRYQSAEGLASDLRTLIERRARGDDGAFPLSERDFPMRILAPSRLIGRDAEIQMLRRAFDDATAGRSNGLFVSGPPGVGKTALVDELRAVVTANGGWYVRAKFDQFQQNVEASAARVAFRRLVSLLLAEPEEELAPIRARLLGRLGSGVGTAAGIVPELSTLLGVAPVEFEGDATSIQSRIAQLGLDLLRSIASPERPVVYVLDDLQWAAATPLGFLDAVMTEAPAPGVLLVGVYRAADVDSAHPLYALLARWRRMPAPPRSLLLADLPPEDLGDLLRAMLRLPRAEAADLADAVGARTHGNPYDTVELIDGLRRDGALRPGVDGWTWDPATIRAYVGQGDVVDLLNGRIDALPATSQRTLEVMACLGGDVSARLLEAAGDVDSFALEASLLPSLSDGLISYAGGSEPAFRFRHDRVQQAAYGRLENGAVALRLQIARRLAAANSFELLAAEQYLAALEAVHDPGERLRAVALFRSAALRSAATANHAAAERFLTAALALLRSNGEDDDALVSLLEIELHAALYALGRLEEADAVYRSIERRSASPLDLIESACLHISSLTNRNLPFEAVAMGLALLRRIDVAPPEPSLLEEAVARRLETIYAFADGSAEYSPQTHPGPSVVAAAKIIRRIMPASFFSGQLSLASWLCAESLSLWERYGPQASLVGPISHVNIMTTTKEDYAVGYRVVRRILGEAEALGYEPETSFSRFLFALTAQYWFEPAERCVVEARRAHDGLLQNGELHLACHAYYATVPLLLASCDSIDEFASETEAALTLAHRIGNDQSAELLLAYRQLARSLRGETNAEGAFTDASFDDDAHMGALGTNPMAAGYFHLMRAYGALIFGQTSELVRHTDAAMEFYTTMTAVPAGILTRILVAVAAARRLADARAEDRAALLQRLDASRDWLRQRALDAPNNFLYAVHLVEAERASALDDFSAASAAFEAALRAVGPTKSPLLAAIVAERAGLFYLEHGLERYARLLLADATQAYRAWGASAKVRQLERVHGAMLVAAPAGPLKTRTTVVSSESIDMMGILRASQALSSQTSLERLKERVGELVAGLTGATSVLLAIRDDAAGEWSLTTAGETISVTEAGVRGLLPLAIFRFVERTGESLVLADATSDNRFARDPYFADSEHLSMLVVPLFSKGRPRAMLLLENRLGRNAFSPDRLDAVTLIAGQLTVSLDNALLYASLEEKVAQRTEALAAANRQLASLSLTDALTGLANRRDFDMKLEAEWSRARRSGTALGVAMIDVDEFKKFNDAYGHPAGDLCLQRVSRVLGSGLRAGNDVAARYGGEEFALILPDTTLGGIYSVAERIRSEIAALAEPHPSAAHGVVTVSIGVTAVVPFEGGEATACVRAADVALYEAKRSGRNRVVRAAS